MASDVQLSADGTSLVDSAGRVISVAGGSGGGSPWTENIDAATFKVTDVGKISLGTSTDTSTVMLLEMGGSHTFVAGEHVVLHEYGSYAATFNATSGGSFIGVHITPSVLGNASVTEIVGIQSQVSSITDVTTQIHAVEALVNFGTIGKTAAMSRSVWAQTVAAFGTITEGIGLDATGGSGAGTITTMYGVRVGRTSGTLMLQGTTKYGVYVNQGSVRNYFGGDTQFGGGTNGTWDSKVGTFDSSGLAVVGITAVTGTTPQVLVGVSTHAGGLTPELSLETAFTQTATASRVGWYVGGTKTFSTNTGSSYYAGYVAPAVSTNVAMSEVVGLSVAPSIDRHSAATPTITNIYGLYVKPAPGIGVTATTSRVIYALLSIAFGTVTTGVGVDIASVNSFGTLTTAIGLRITDLAGGSTKWGMQVGDYQSYHEGDFRIGAISAGSTAAPAAKLDVIQETAGAIVQKLSTVETNDDISEAVYQTRITTTDATVTTIFTFTVPTDTAVHIDAFVTGRRTGGAGGAAQDAAGYRVGLLAKITGGVAAIINGALHYSWESQVGWAVTTDATGGTVRIRVTGAASNNVTWHCVARVYAVST